jgi:hypothetical protein
MRLGRHALLTLCFVLASAGAASAEPTQVDKTQAATLKKRGDEEMESLRYAEALTDYTEAYRLTSDPALLYNRARVLEALERFPEALAELERFSHEASPQLRAKVPQLKELMKDLGARITTLSIRCNVDNARVLVRDKIVATTPLEGPIRVNAGQAAIEVVADGYHGYKQTFELPKGGSITVDVELTLRDARGVLLVATTPTGSDLRIDGQAFGRTPVEASLAAGNHVVVVSHDGYENKQTNAVVVEGQKKSIDVALDKNPSIFAKWWFWTGVAVVVAGAVIITVAVTTEKSAGHGDIPPGQVAGPLRF